MSDERFKLSKYVTPSSVSNFCDEKGRMLNKEVVKVLNEQQATIQFLQNEIDELKKDIDIYEYEEKKHSETARKLHEDNEHLRQMIKENVFERYRESSLADLEFKAIAYDDIVKLEMSYESEPKVIVICKQGKKENVKSFCQFIPLGVYYEIKELENE